MKQNFKNLAITLKNKGRRNVFLTFATCLLISYSVPIVAQEKPDKIQRSIDLIKKANYSENADYHTDGQRTVWVKSYKKWTPYDFGTIQKEAPKVLTFLRQAIDHNRLDVLEQLLPDYYRYNGGVKVFAKDIMNAK